MRKIQDKYPTYISDPKLIISLDLYFTFQILKFS